MSQDHKLGNEASLAATWEGRIPGRTASKGTVSGVHVKQQGGQQDGAKMSSERSRGRERLHRELAQRLSEMQHRRIPSTEEETCSELPLNRTTQDVALRMDHQGQGQQPEDFAGGESFRVPWTRVAALKVFAVLFHSPFYVMETFIRIER